MEQYSKIHRMYNRKLINKPVSAPPSLVNIDTTNEPENKPIEDTIGIPNIDDIFDQCNKLVDQNSLLESKIHFMNKSIESYEQATILLGYFSQLQDFKSELIDLNNKLTNHRKKILETYIDILPQEIIKSLSIPSINSKLYQKGIHKFYKAKNYIIYHYRQKLYTELESENKQINNIREIVHTIIRLDKHYDIYDELIVDLRQKNKIFDQIMNKHLTEFLYF